MTQIQHNLVAGIIIIILYQIIFHKILKHHPVAQKNMQEWLNIYKEWI